MLHKFRLRINPKQDTKDCDIVYLPFQPQINSLVIVSEQDTYKVVGVIFVNGQTTVDLCVVKQ